MKKALIHEWYTQYAGSEKCVESFTNIWDDFDHFALVDFLNDEDREVILKGKPCTTSFIQNLPFSASFRNYLPLFPYAVEQFDVSEYDLVFSNSHAVAKGVITRTDQLHVCYCHSPMRYAWDLYHQYIREAGLTKGLKAALAKWTLHKLRIWDYTTRNRVDHFMANSHYTAQRINKIYERDAEVIYPPVDVDNFQLTAKKDDYYLTASRLVPYKKIDLIVEAFSRVPDQKLIVIGDGGDMEKVKAKAGPNVEILGYQPFRELKTLMQNAKAFVFAAVEDFGIVNVEAMACGTPVIALNKAGTAETVKDGVSGIHFNEQTTRSIAAAVNRFEAEQDSFDPEAVRAHAEQFSRAAYEKNVREFVEKKIESFFG